MGDIRAQHLRDRDFLGAFALIEDAEGILFVQNRRHFAGREQLTWDLPGGQVEPGETLDEALARELDEEIGVRPATAQLLFVQEGERRVASGRQYVWRSFFFAVPQYEGRPRARGEILGVTRLPRARLSQELTAPYHASFLEWLATGGLHLRCRWQDLPD